MMELKNRIIEKNDTLSKSAYLYLESPRDERLADVVENSRGLIGYFIQLYGCGHSRDDLYQVGVEGLLKALQRYNLDSDISFSTYAGHCIMGEIRHYVRKEGSYYRPAVIGKLQSKVEKLIEKELDETGSIPEASNLADKLNIREEGLNEVMRAGLVPLDTLDISKVASQRLESFRLPVEDRIALEQALNKLSDLQRKVIHLLFYRDMTQDQAAEKLNINQRKVSRVLHSSLSTLRGNL